jgi:tellurite resistance protein
MAQARKPRSGSQRRGLTLDRDQALIALFIAAMEANGHVAPEESARAHHLIWSTRRFRRKSGDAVGRLIHNMRRLLEERGTDAVTDAAARTIPARVRPPAFALLADLLLADGKMDAQERRFLHGIGSRLAIEPETVRQVIEAMLLKNRL